MAIPSPQELIKAGVHLGHQKSRWNPKMAPFVFGVRNNFHVIDVFKTTKKIEEAIGFLRGVIEGGGNILFVGVKVQTKNIVLDTARAMNMPYVVGRWLGGLFTNFKVVKGRIDHLKDMEDKKLKGEIEKYTKKEQLNFDRQMAKLESELGGLKNLAVLPKAVFVSDLNREKIAVTEAKKLNIPVVAIVDTNGDPNLVEYPIPANDSAVSSVSLIYKTIREELENVKAKPAAEEAPKETKEPVKPTTIAKDKKEK